MTVLLVLASVLLLVSGSVKVHAAGRAKIDTPFLSLVEVLAALALGATALMSPPTEEIGFRYAVGAVGLVLVSSISMGMRLSTRRRERDDSEGVRLITYVKYISASSDAASPDPDGPTE